MTENLTVSRVAASSWRSRYRQPGKLLDSRKPAPAWLLTSYQGETGDVAAGDEGATGCCFAIDYAAVLFLRAALRPSARYTVARLTFMFAATSLMTTSGSASNLREWQICCVARYSYRVLGPIDKAGWISLGDDGTELPLTTISDGCPVKPAVFLLSVARSIASEHKMKMALRIAAIIRRSIEGVTAAAPGYAPR